MHQKKKQKNKLLFIISLLLLSTLFITGTSALTISNQTINDLIGDLDEYLDDLNLSNLTKNLVIKDTNQTLNKTINTTIKLITGPIINLTNISINNQTIGDIVKELENNTNLSINMTVKTAEQQYQEKLKKCKIVQIINNEKPHFTFKFKEIAKRFPPLQILIH